MVHQQNDDDTTTTDDDRCVDVRAAGKILGISPETLNQWRRHGKGPAFRRYSAKAIRYSMGDLRAYMDACRIGGKLLEKPTRRVRKVGAK